MKRPSDRRSLSRSATRALDVLEYFGVARKPLRAIEIARMLGMQPSTTDQLLKTMVDSAHLVFDARTKTYAPSPRLIGFSGWIIDTYGAGEVLRELVRDVQHRTGMPVTLTTPNDLFMQIIDFAEPDQPVTERGLRVSIFGTAYLSRLDTSEVERLARRGRIAEESIPELLATLHEVRRLGYADAPGGDTLWSLAMPLPTQGPRVPVVLELAGPKALVHADQTELVRAMRGAIEHWIGPVAAAAPAADHSKASSKVIVPPHDSLSASG